MLGMGEALAPQFTSKSQHDERFSPTFCERSAAGQSDFGIHLPRIMSFSPSALIRYGLARRYPVDIGRRSVVQELTSEAYAELATMDDI
jgi:hypothetical protein